MPSTWDGIGGILPRKTVETSNYLFHLKPDEATLSGSAVTAWSDSGYTLTPYSDNPAYVADYFGAGLPAVHFTGDHCIGNLAFRDLHSGRAYLAYVGVIDMVIGGWQCIYFMNGAGSTSYSNGFQVSSISYLYASSTTATGATMTSAAPSGTSVWAHEIDYSTGTQRYYLNSLTATKTEAFSSPNGVCDTFTAAAWVLGALTETGNQTIADGKYGDFLALDDPTLLSTAISELATKYSITLT